MALLGGPIGVAILAGAAIYYFATQATDAEKAVSELNPELDGLVERYNELGTAQKELVRQGFETSINKQKQEVEDLTKKLEGLHKVQVRVGVSMMGIGATSLEEPTQQILETTAELEKAQKELADLQSQFDSIKPPVAEVNSFIESMTSLNNVLGFFVKGNAVEKPFSMLNNVVQKPEEVKLTQDNTPKNESNVQKEINEMMEKEKKQMEMYENEKRGAASVTESLKMELANRQLASDNYRKVQAAEALGVYEQERILIQAQSQEEIAEINKRQAEDTQRREEQLRQAVDHEELEQWQKREIRKAYQDQELAALEVYEAQKTAIQERAAQNRKDVDELERKARMNSFISMGSALMALGEGQSKKVFETGKTLALASAAVNLPSAVLESYNNSGGYPWGIPAAVAMGAVGLKQISDIKNARFGSTPSSSSQSAAPTPEAAPSQGGGAPAGNFTVAGYDPRSLYTGEQLQGLGTALQDWWKNGGGDGTIMYQGA
jgi:hypothetical protein